MQLSKKIHLRLARENDFQDVLTLSEGIYDGADYIPLVFHDWLKIPNKLLFVAELRGKVIGLGVANIVSDGKTFFGQALRIHPEYRGQGWSYPIMVGAIDYIRRMYPQVSKMHYTVARFYSPQTLSVAKRLGDTMLEERNYHYFKVKKQGNFRQELSSRFKKVKEKALDLYSYDKSDAASIITNKHDLDFIAPQKIMIRFSEPYEAIPSNMKYIFRENDKMFADVSREELKQGKIPSSFSHGHLTYRLRHMFWRCAVYANDLESFRSHVLRQLKSATEIIGKDFVFIVDVVGSKISSDEGKKVLEEELLSLKQNIVIESDTLHLFERVLDKPELGSVVSKL